MTIELNEQTAKIVKELAAAQGMTEDEVIEQIIQWYLEDCRNEK